MAGNKFVAKGFLDGNPNEPVTADVHDLTGFVNSPDTACVMLANEQGDWLGEFMKCNVIWTDIMRV